MSREFKTPILLPGDPTADLQAATKQYVDDNAGGGGGGGGGGGALVYLGEFTAAGGSSEIDIDIPAGYLGVHIRGYVLGSTVPSLRMRMGEGSVDTGSNYDYARYFYGDSASGSSGDGTDHILLGSLSDADEGGALQVDIFPGYDDDTQKTIVQTRLAYFTGTSQWGYITDGKYMTDAAVDVLRIYPTSGTMSATFHMWGYTDEAGGGGGGGGAPAWQDYTPDWTAETTDPTLGNGTLTGRYQQFGTTVHCEIRLEAGSTTTFGASTWYFSLPVEAADIRGVGSVRILEAGVDNDLGVAFIDTTTRLLVLAEGTNVVHATAPHTWGDGDMLDIAITYEAVTSGGGGGGGLIDRAVVSYQGGNLTGLNATTWTAVTTSADLTLDAAAGDIIQIRCSGYHDRPDQFGGWDLATIVSGSIENHVSGDPPPTLGLEVIVSAGLSEAPDQASLSLAGTYEVTADDVVSGQVTFRLVYKLNATPASTMTVRANGDTPLRLDAVNLGSV